MIKELLVLTTLCSSGYVQTDINYEHGVPENAICIENPGISLASVESHPAVEGMSYAGGYDRAKAGDKASGYFYYDLNIYTSQFTSVSKLYLINVKVDFTSGWIAKQNDMEGYDDAYNLDKGYVHVGAVNHFEDDGDVSASIKLLASWPSSSSSTSSVSSGFSASYTSNWTSGIELSWPNGVKVDGQSNNGLSFRIDHSTTISTDEPYVSTQTSPSNSYEQQWNYQYKDLGRATYTLDTFYLIEVKNDGVGFNDYGFVFDINLCMSNVAWKNWWWEGHDPQYHAMRIYYNLGRNPGD